MNKRIFIVQDDGSKNFGPAIGMGELSTLAIRDLPVHHDPTHELGEIKRKLLSFTDDDYLLLTGDPLIIGAAMVYAAMVNRGTVNCLKWDKQSKGYYPVKLKLF